MSFVAFAVMVAIAIIYIASLGVRLGPPSHRTNVSMKVADVNSLVVGSNVLFRGVPVGKVSKIEAAVDGATVDFYIDGRYRIPVDSDVRLANLSALGESYIGLVPRSQDGPMLHDGQHIATESVIQPPSISELATSVVRVLNQLDPEALKRITDEADTALPDANSVLPHLSRASTLLRNTAADMQGRGQVVLDNFQTLLRNAGWLGPLIADIARTLPDFGVRLQQTINGFLLIVYQGAPYTILKLNHLVDRVQNFLDERGGDLKVLGEAFEPQTKKIAGALLNFDPSQILSNILATVPEDGAITLHVAIPPK